MIVDTENPVIASLLARQVPVRLRRESLVIEGFYKSGEIYLTPRKEGGFIAVSRYAETHDIESFDDLVHLNYEWWKRSKDRFDGWSNPDKNWAADFERLGLVEKKVETKYVPKS